MANPGNSETAIAFVIAVPRSLAKQEVEQIFDALRLLEGVSVLDHGTRYGRVLTTKMIASEIADRYPQIAIEEEADRSIDRDVHTKGAE